MATNIIKIPFGGDTVYDQTVSKSSIANFHLIAKKIITPDQGTCPYCILCSDSSTTDNYYFSSDPRDFQLDDSVNSLSKGAVGLKYESNGTKFTFNDVENNSSVFPFQNINIPSVKDPNTEENLKLDLVKKHLYYGVQYEFSPPSSYTIRLRKPINESIGISQGACGIFPDTSFNNPFFAYGGTCVYQDGTNIAITGSASDFYIKGSSLPKITTYLNGSHPSIFSKKRYVVLELKKDNKIEYVNATKRSPSNNDLKILPGGFGKTGGFRNIYGSQSLGTGAVTGIENVKMDIRYDPRLFERRSMTGFNYYIIPTKNYGSYFDTSTISKASGITAPVVPFKSLPIQYWKSPGNTVYQSGTGLSIGGAKNQSPSYWQPWNPVNFFVFYASSLLDTTTYWQYINHNTQATNDSGQIIPAYSWASSASANSGFIAPYCNEDQECSHCTTGAFCYPSPDAPAIISGKLEGNPMVPSVKTTNDDVQIFIWSSFGITCFLLLLWLIVFYYLIDSLTASGKISGISSVVNKIPGLSSITGPTQYSTELDNDAKLGFDISDQSYKDTDDREDVGDWKYKKDDSDKNIAVYHNPKTNESYIGYRGTKDLDDVKVDAIDKEGNIVSGSQRNNPRFKRSLAKYNEVKGKYGGKTMVTGHSLGGTISEHVSKETGAEAQLFNPGRGLDKETLKEGAKCKLPKGLRPEFCNNVTKHIIEGDPVSVGDRMIGYGKTHIYKNPNEKGEGKIGKITHSVKAHSLDNFEKYT